VHKEKYVPIIGFIHNLHKIGIKSRKLMEMKKLKPNFS